MNLVMTGDVKDDVSRKSGSPWAELLVDSAVPATAVAVTLGDDAPIEQPIVAKEPSKDKLSVLGNLQRRTFSRISFNGEAGPLLSR